MWNGSVNLSKDDVGTRAYPHTHTHPPHTPPPPPTTTPTAASAFLVPSAAPKQQQQRRPAMASRVQQGGIVMLSPGKPNLGKGAWGWLRDIYAYRRWMFDGWSGDRVGQTCGLGRHSPSDDGPNQCLSNAPSNPIPNPKTGGALLQKPQLQTATRVAPPKRKEKTEVCLKSCVGHWRVCACPYVCASRMIYVEVSHTHALNPNTPLSNHRSSSRRRRRSRRSSRWF